MRTIRIAVSMTAVLCMFATVASTAAMAEVEEFLKPGNKVTVVSGNSALGLQGGEVVCETAAGSGEVATATITKLEVKYEKCKAYLGKEFKEFEAKVTPCKGEISSEHTFALTGGCKVEASGCVVEPATTKLGGEVDYLEVKEEAAELETDAAAAMKEVEVKAGALCELVGIKSGKATFATNLTVTGAGTTQQRYVYVIGASKATEKTMVLKNLPSTIVTFTFPGNAVIECGKLEAKGPTAFETRYLRRVGPYHVEECKGNLINAGSKIALENSGKMDTTNCMYLLGAGNSIKVSPWPGWAGNEEINFESSCKFEAVAKEGATVCKIKFSKNQIGMGVWLTNETGATKTIGIKYSETNRAPFELGYRAETCPNVPAAASNAVFKGEAKLEIEGGTATEVK